MKEVEQKTLAGLTKCSTPQNIILERNNTLDNSNMDKTHLEHPTPPPPHLHPASTPPPPLFTIIEGDTKCVHQIHTKAGIRLKSIQEVVQIHWYCVSLCSLPCFLLIAKSLTENTLNPRSCKCTTDNFRTETITYSMSKIIFNITRETKRTTLS